MNRFVKTSAAGASLVEVMICVAIFMIGLGSLLDVSIQSLGMGKRAEFVYTSYSLARNHIERLKAYDFADLSAASESSTLLNEDGDPDDDGLFARSTTVTVAGNTAAVTVTVSYTMKGVQSAAPMQMSCVIYNSG